MTGYCVSDIAAITGGVLSGDGAAPVTGAVIDSRAVTPGALFAAIPGERVDGHDYIGKAFDLGASCCLAQRVPVRIAFNELPADVTLVSGTTCTVSIGGQ